VAALIATSELFENLFRFLWIVTDDRQLDQTVSNAGYVNCLEVDARLAQSTRDVGQYAGLVFEEHDMDFALRELDARRLQRTACYYDIVRENARHRLAGDGHCRNSFDVDTTAAERLRYSTEVAGVVRELDQAVSHTGLQAGLTVWAQSNAPVLMRVAL
jgi:hypothetical protein